MKRREIVVGEDYAVRAPNAHPGRVERARVTDTSGWAWVKQGRLARATGRMQQDPKAQGVLAVKVRDDGRPWRAHEEPHPDLIPASHFVRTWAEHEAVEEERRAYAEQAGREREAAVALYEARAQGVVGALAEVGITVKAPSVSYWDSDPDWTLDMDTMEALVVRVRSAG